MIILWPVLYLISSVIVVKIVAEHENSTWGKNKQHLNVKSSDDEESKQRLLKQQVLFNQQHKDIQVLV